MAERPRSRAAGWLARRNAAAGGGSGWSGGTGHAAAAEYSMAHGGIGLHVVRASAAGPELVFEQFGPLRDADTAHFLASSSKSLCGVMAAAALSDGLLTLDEPVSATITRWADDPQKSKITIRDLLTMSSGLQFVPPPGISFDAALNVPLTFEPGSRFDYNGANFQVFGAVLRHKLGGAAGEPLDWFRKRVLDPMELLIDDWRTAGNDPFLPGGASASARQMAKLGVLLLGGGVWQGKQLMSAEAFVTLLQPSAHHPGVGLPGYGLTFWLLDRYVDDPAAPDEGTAAMTDQLKSTLEGAFMAAGLGGQRLYVIPRAGLAIVRQARLLGAFGGGSSLRDLIGGHGFDDRVFLRAALG